MESYKSKVIKWVDDQVAWTKLKPIQNHNLIKSTYIWLLIVPVAVNLIQFGFELCESSLPEVTDCNQIFNFTIPFAWQWFYVAALIFTVANIGFVWFSPEIIKLFIDFEDFDDRGRKGNVFGKVDLSDIGLLKKGIFLPRAISAEVEFAYSQSELDVKDLSLQKSIDDHWESQKKEVYRNARICVDKTKIVSRWIIGSLYLAGGGIAVYVFGVTIIKTLRHLF